MCTLDFLLIPFHFPLVPFDCLLISIWALFDIRANKEIDTLFLLLPLALALPPSKRCARPRPTRRNRTNRRGNDMLALCSPPLFNLALPLMRGARPRRRRRRRRGRRGRREPVATECLWGGLSTKAWPGGIPFAGLRRYGVSGVDAGCVFARLLTVRFFML